MSSPLRQIWSFFIDSIQTFFIAAAIFLVIYIFLFRPFQVNGRSMFPNFENNEYVLTNIISLRFEELKRGDVVVFKAPQEVEKDYIKRVIAVAGEKVSLKDSQVYINDKKLNESAYLSPDVKTEGRAFLAEGGSYEIKPGEFFVLGDNRPVSSDSREWGPVKKTEIIGKSFFVYWPVGKMKVIKNPF